MTGNKPKRAKAWSLYPALHDDVLLHLKDSGLSPIFHRTDDDNSCEQSYDTHVMGRFRCHNQSCQSAGWSSKKIALTIRQYSSPHSSASSSYSSYTSSSSSSSSSSSGTQYNARVYYQRCKACNRLSKPILDDSYAERIAYRLKSWGGIKVERPYFVKNLNRPPHKKELCEGCKAGHCTEGLD